MNAAAGKTGYEVSRAFSQNGLNSIRSVLAPIIPQDAIAVTFGSYARREASASSDLDYSLLLSDDQAVADQTRHDEIKATICSVIPVDPAVDGAFGGSVTKSSLITNLGGDADSNKNITRRMLLLLEGEWLTNEEGFDALRLALLTRYAEATPKDHQLALFLLRA